MDGNRPVDDRLDILESELQGLVRDAFFCGFMHGLRRDVERFKGYKIYDSQIHELLISYLDGSSSDVGAQDEVSEAREVGDGVRPKPHLIPRDPNAFVVDEWDPIKKVADEFAREMELRFAYEGKKVAIGHCDLTKKPDGSIHARIEYYPQDKESDEEDTDEYGWIREEDVPEGWKKSPHAVFSDFIRQYSGPQNPR